MSGTPPALEGSDSVDESGEAVEVKIDYEARSKQFQETLESYKKKMEEASTKLEGIKSPAMASTVSKRQGGKVVSLSDVKKVFRRDFKIAGVIKAEEQKDRLSFVSLLLKLKVVLCNRSLRWFAPYSFMCL